MVVEERQQGNHFTGRDLLLMYWCRVPEGGDMHVLYPVVFSLVEKAMPLQFHFGPER